MKIIIVGYGKMMQSIVKGISASNNEIVGVLRHENVLYSPFKRFLLDIFNPSSDFNFLKLHKINDIKQRSVNSKKFIDYVKKTKTDLIITASWSEKFSPQTLNSPKLACINVHPSLLPKYRGPNPYAQVILNNEKITGVTFHLMDVNYDTGAIICQIPVEIASSDTGLTLKYRCCDAAESEIARLLKDIKEYISNAKSQDESISTYRNQLTLKDSILDFENETSEQIERRIRALNPWMKCYIPYNNQFFSFSHSQVCKNKSRYAPASIVKITENSLFIVCADKNIMKFSNLKIKMPFPKFSTKLFLKKFVKINSKAI